MGNNTLNYSLLKQIGGIDIYIFAVLLVIQFIISVVVGIYLMRSARGQRRARGAAARESNKELRRLEKLRAVSLTAPLSECTRPKCLDEIVGQEQGIRALRAALCCANPQHVLIYGPPGVGKTAAARAVLTEARAVRGNPFGLSAKCVEIDATTLRYDERGIADPLIGSVHDPIYQGAGGYGLEGIPQPKPGAVTHAHGGILFIDEIGELPSVQMNKLLKVLEDRRVFFESSYYCSEDKRTPPHIHDVFKNGLPADFRLIGATTRRPEDVPKAVRSRCVEIFFRSLTGEELIEIAKNAAERGGYRWGDETLPLIERYAGDGREAVKITQTAGSIAVLARRRFITRKDVEWVLEAGKYSPRYEPKAEDGARVGAVNGLAVTGGDEGLLIEVEVSAVPAAGERGEVVVTGMIESEEISGRGGSLRRTSQARVAVMNVLTALKAYGVRVADYDLHVNVPGALVVDGPSAGCAVAAAIYSAISGALIGGRVAMTGEVTVRGEIRAVGGVPAKVVAAARAGVRRVFVPRENWEELSGRCGDVEVVPIGSVGEILRELGYKKSKTRNEKLKIAE